MVYFHREELADSKPTGITFPWLSLVVLGRSDNIYIYSYLELSLLTVTTTVHSTASFLYAIYQKCSIGEPCLQYGAITEKGHPP